MEKFEAAVASGEHTSGAGDLINLAENLDCYDFYIGVSDDETLGRIYAEDMEMIDIPENLRDYFDYEAYGRDMRINEDGSFVKGGFFLPNGSQFIEYYGDITRYFVKHSIKVYDKALQRAFISKLLRNPVYVQADMDIYEYFKAQGVKIESTPEMFTGDNSCYLYQGREGEEQILVIAPHQGRITSQLWLTVQRKLSQNTSFQNGRKCHNTWLAGKIKCGRCGYALTALRAQNGVTYLRCKQRADNGSCEGAGTLTAQSMESFVYGEMVEKMRKYHTLKGGKEQGYNPKLTAARVALAKTESEIEKLLDTLSGANPLLLQYANNRIEELDTERQKQLKLVADLTANSVSDTQIDCITNYLNDWESVSFDDKRKVVDILISHIDATSESVTIHWKI